MKRTGWAGLIAALLIGGPVLAQTGSITGTVTGADAGGPVVGATVRVAGTDRGAITGDDGRYTVRVDPGTYTVRVTRIGYSPDSLSGVVVAQGGVATVNFVLQPSATQLGDLVVTGYGTRQARDLTGSVATVSEGDFNTGRIVSAEELIQAKIPGVQVIRSGEPGGGTSIRIRGGTSINASNEPLFVVDGIPLPVGGGLSAGRNPLTFLNPEDIQTITVLKDASATAIYGSQGANGVIMITTKSGTTPGPQFSYRGSASTSRSVSEPSMLSANQLRTVIAEYAPGNMQYLGDANTNWRSAVLQNATGQEHSLAVSGAGDDMNYRLSLGYLGQDGVVRGSTVERYSAALNYNHRLFDDRLAVRASLRGARTDDQFTPGGGLGAATIFDPTQPIRIGSDFFEQTNFQLAPNNPVAELALAVSEGTTFRSIANLEAAYRVPFLEGLTATTQVGYDLATSERRVFEPTTMWAQAKSPNPGYVSRSNPRESSGQLAIFGTYAADLDRYNSDLEVTAGYAYGMSRGDYPFFEARGLTSDLLGESGIPTAHEIRTVLNVREGKNASFFGRANYSLHDRYLLTASIRRDASSRFGPGNQWGTFPAAAVAWRMSSESFLENVDWLSDLKLRVSWGVNGNQAIGDYLWAASYRFGDQFARAQFGNEFVTTIRPTAVDPNIKWEETTSYNIGLEYGIARNRFYGSVDYYRKNTDDLIFRVPVAAGTHVSNFVTTNIGSVRNNGFEFSFNARVLEPAQSALSWTANFNASTNTNRLLTINPFGGGTERILVGGISGGIGNQVQVLQPGQAVNTFLLYQHKRDASGRPIYSANALDMYVDVNNDGIINEDDRVPAGNPVPKWILGHTSQFGYGNADLSFTVRAHRGNRVYNNLASSHGFYNRVSQAAGPVNLHSSVLANGFVTDQFLSDVYLEDASFVRMDHVTVGYTLPRMGTLQQVRIFGTVQNVFTITDYSGVDPEVFLPGDGTQGIDNNIYPRSRTFTIGAGFGF